MSEPLTTLDAEILGCGSVITAELVEKLLLHPSRLVAQRLEAMDAAGLVRGIGAGEFEKTEAGEQALSAFEDFHAARERRAVISRQRHW